ncbi:MAG: tail fiber domain-containing protein, partial [Verrucomicrobia bacterium]|nr:tail fiber domain-containing protein [Verrucomicrobiota bacterium]
GFAGLWGSGCGWNLVMNRTNGNVGIGTAAPSTKLQVNGTVTATAFAGNGAGLTSVNADQLDGQHGAFYQNAANLIGTVPLAQLPSTVVTNGETGLNLTGAFAGNGAGLTSVNADQLDGQHGAFYQNAANLTGTVPLAQLPSAVVTNGETGLSLTGTFSGDGAGLSQLNSYNLTGPLTVAPRPSLAGHIDNGGTAQGVAVAGNYCYLANGEDGLRIYDISDPANPTNVAHMLDGGSYGNAMGVAVAGHYCYVANYNDGLRIYDVSNPSSPVNVGRITGSGGPALGVAVAGNYCYLANFSAGLQIIDISTPTSPVSRSSTSWGDRPCSVAVAGNYCYLGSWDGGLRIANVSNPSSPSPVGWINNGGMALGVAVAGNYCYLANHSDGLRVYDVSNPAGPVNVGHVNEGGYAQAVAVTGNLCYLGAGGLRAYDVSTPSNPVPAGYVSSSGGGQGVAVAGNYCYLAAGSDGLRVHALGTATIPSLITSGLTVKDRLLLSPGANGTAGLFLQSTDGANAVFLGMMDDGFAGLWGSGCGWNLVMNRTNGNVGIGNNNPSNKLMVVSARCDGSSWINASDRHLKQSFTAVDPRSVLEKVTALPVQTWSYKAQPAEKHLGPVAQDFFAAFGLGTDDKAISTVDESGVALAAIQGLNQKVDDTVKQKDAEIQALKASVAELQEAVRRLTSTAK